MAARTRQPNHDERARAKIRSSQLINRLIAFAMGEVEMTGAQVTAALGLIKKTLPDLRHVTLTGAGGGPLQVEDARQRNLDLIDGVAGRSEDQSRALSSADSVAQASATALGIGALPPS